jgi:hypothetical protein
MAWLILLALVVLAVLFGVFMSRRQKRSPGAKHFDSGLRMQPDVPGSGVQGAGGPEAPYFSARTVTGGAWVEEDLLATPDEQTYELLERETTEEPDDFIEPANVADREIWEEQRETAIRNLKAENDVDDATRHPRT